LLRFWAVLEACGLATWHPAMAQRGQGKWPAVFDGLEEFRQHLGGELTITLIDGIGSAFEVHEIDADLMADAAELLRGMFNEERERTWEPMPARAH
jgi:3-dehydroquinate synthase